MMAAGLKRRSCDANVLQIQRFIAPRAAALDATAVVH
jgi:hypothetical protein